MSAPGKAAADKGSSAALVITHTLRRGGRRRYEQWAREILGAVSSHPGYLGREVLLPTHGNREFTTIVRFDSEEHNRSGR